MWFMTLPEENVNLSMFIHTLIWIGGVQVVVETMGVDENIGNWYNSD